MNKVSRWVFRYVGNKTIDFSSKKKDFLPQNNQIWPEIGIFGQFGPGHAGLFNALLWVGWWLGRAGCISQDTFLLYNKYAAYVDDDDDVIRIMMMIVMIVSKSAL